MPPRFTFRLQRLLDQRISNEKRQQIELVRRRGVVAAEQRKLQELKDREQMILRRMTPGQGEVLNIQERTQCEYWLEQTMKEQVAQEGVLQQAMQAVREQELTVQKAGQDVKVLEKLKEKQREDFRVEQLRIEQYFLDDVANQQFIRRERQDAERAAAAEARAALEVAE